MIFASTVIDPAATVPFIYEAIILGVGVVFNLLIAGRYRARHNDLTKYLLIAVSFYILAILFSWVGKLLTMYYAGDFTTEAPILQEIYGRIYALRVTFAFVGCATLVIYKFASIVFEKQPNPVVQKLIYVFGLFTIFFSIVVYSPSDKSLNLPAFLLVFLLMVIVYLPFMVKSLLTSRRMAEKTYKHAFYALAIMSLSYMLCFFFFIIDNISQLVAGTRFSIFYYLGWLSVIFAIILGYFGYIRPGSTKEHA